MNYLKQITVISACFSLMTQNLWGMRADDRPVREPFHAAKPLPDSPEETCIESIFLGPGAENAGLLEELVMEALQDHIYWRRNIHPADPTHISEEIKRSPAYLKSLDLMKRQFRLLLADLKKSVPPFSFRFQAHINWELTIPSMVGYLAAMLHNPNNVAFEGSPATSFMEEQVARDFCKLIGYPVLSEEKERKSKIYAWGQLTSGGTTANIQALWALRNLKFFPLAIKWALNEPNLSGIKESLMVKRPSGDSVKLIDLDPWALLNIENDEVLSLPEKILQLLGEKSPPDAPLPDLNNLYKLISKYSLQKKGVKGFYDQIAKETKSGMEIGDPVILAPGTGHYSFPKAVSLMGMGEDSLINIPVGINARMDMVALKAQLSECEKKRQPVIAVVAVIGSTEESAVDNLCGILDVRKKFREKGLDFPLHADAAFGGYHASLVERRKPFAPPVIPLNEYVNAQFLALNQVDTVTIDPHKSGYIPYPAGGLCYRDERLKRMTNFSAPVLGTPEASEPSVGVYGVEGSRSGAPAAAVYLSHRVIPLTPQGHGKLLGQALYTTKEFFLRLLDSDSEDYIVVPLARLPGDSTTREAYEKEKKELVNKLNNLRPSKGKESKEFERELRQIGPDLNMLVYAFNLREKGIPNKDLETFNILNKEIYNQLKPYAGKEAAEYKLILSNTTLESGKYGTSCLENYLERLGITTPSEKPYSLNVLRSVVMNPWATETEKGSMLGTIMKDLTDVVKSVLKAKPWTKSKQFHRAAL